MMTYRRWIQLIAVLLSWAAVTGYAWLFTLLDSYRARYFGSFAYWWLVPLVMVVAGLPLVGAEVLARLRHKPMRLVVMAASGFLVGITVAKAIRIEAQEPSDQAVDTGVTRLD